MVTVLAVNSVIDFSQGERDQAYSTLVRQVALGNEGALAQLYDSTNRLVYGLALRIVGDASSAEDIALEVYLYEGVRSRKNAPRFGQACRIFGG
jgi:hypothetical protein